MFGYCIMIQYTKYLFKKSNTLPIYLILDVTSLCNSKCLMCFNWEKTELKKEMRLSLEELEKISSSMGNLFWLALGGGEPFLRDDLPDLIKIFEKNNKVKHVTTATNALQPEKIRDMTKQILENGEYTFLVNISIDGIGELHNHIRGVKNNFKKTLETYKLLSDLKTNYKRLNIGVNTTISNLNQDHIKEIYNFVKKNMPNVESHSFEQIRGSTRDPNIKPPSIDFYEKNKEFFKGVITNYKYYNLYRFNLFLKSVKKYYHDLSIKIIKEKKQVIPCYAGKLTCVIDVKGDVYPCELYKKFGNLKEYNYDFKKLWFSERAEDIRKEIKDRKCYCIHSCFQFFNIIFNPCIWPRLIKYTI